MCTGVVFVVYALYVIGLLEKVCFGGLRFGFKCGFLEFLFIYREVFEVFCIYFMWFWCVGFWGCCLCVLGFCCWGLRVRRKSGV